MIMSEATKELLNKLEKSDLIETLVTRKVTADADETVRDFFRELFSSGGHLQRLEAEFDDLRKAVDQLENRTRDNGFESSSDEADVNDGPRLIKDKFVNNGKGQCQSNVDEDSDADEMGNETSPTESYTISQIDSELKQFYRHAKENNLSDEDIARICKPLIQSLEKPFLAPSRVRRAAMVLCAIILLVLSVFYSETLAWHCSAIGRIFFMQLLPIWNWSELKNLKCLVPHFDQSSETSRAIECTFCEFIDKIDATSAVEDEYLSERFIKLHRPIILENTAEKWPYFKPDDNFSVVEAVMDDPILSESLPCKLSTNAFIGTDKLRKVLKNINRHDTYFVHFENCNFDAVKAFRKFFPRPNFLIPEISPIQYSWLLASNNYHVEKFKPLVLREQVTVVGQIVGKNMFVLVPASECVDDCSSLAVDLVAGEALILSSYWNLEYKPDPAGENVAVILEAHY